VLRLPVRRRVVARALAAALPALVILATAAHAGGRCGQHPWCDTTLTPETRAGLLLGAMTQEEKVGLLGGDDIGGVAGGDHTHTGTQRGIPRLDVPTVLYSDGPVGPRQGRSTGLPIPLALAATFDPGLARVHGGIAAGEAKAKGNDVIFGPTMNIMRTPLAGRTFEAYGEDPYLAGRMAVDWVKGAQATGVIADVKHFAANNQEGVDPSGGQVGSQTPIGAGIEGNRMLEDSVVDERTLREVYLPQFEAAIKEAHPGTVMCSYNRLNGQYACENQHLLQSILRQDWGFDGYVLADYGAAHNPIASFNNGLDFEPFPPAAYQPLELDVVLATGLGSTATLDEHVRAMLTTWFRFGLFDRDTYRDDDAQIDKAANAEASERIAEQAMTLLRNQDGVLPLDASKLRSVAVIGKPATTFVTGGGSGAVSPFNFTSVLDGIRKRAGDRVDVTYSDGTSASAAVAAAKAADVAIVDVADEYKEGADRACLTLECPRTHGNQDVLIRQVAAANPKTIVLLQTGGPNLMPWRGDVAGIVQAWYAGAQGGSAVANVLFGDADPGGRLPVTFADSESQLPTAGDRAKYPGVGLRVQYKEGVLVGYRWYDAKRLEPAFPFGFGLSYTTFAIRDLRVVPQPDGATVSVAVTNSGSRAGTAVPQLYLGLPQPSPSIVQPPAQLRGFEKLALKPGETRRATFAVDRRALSYWDTAAGDWRVAPGCVDVMVGASSRDVAQRGVLAAGGATCATPPRTCASRRSVTYRLPRGARAVRVTVAGKARMVRRNGRAVRLALHGLPRGAVHVRISATVSGKRYRRVSTLHPCQRRRR
jgi:beta-glucosidase